MCDGLYTVSESANDTYVSYLSRVNAAGGTKSLCVCACERTYVRHDDDDDVS